MNTNESHGGVDRRTFLRLSAAGAALGVAAGLSGLESNASAASGKAYPKYYFPYHNKPATVIDFGLTAAQEERAAELHKKLVIFDSEPEVDWFDGLFDNMLSGGARGVGGSFTIDAINWAKVHGFEKDLEITKRDWWTMKNIRENVDFIRAKEKTEGKSMKQKGATFTIAPLERCDISPCCNGIGWLARA